MFDLHTVEIDIHIARKKNDRKLQNKEEINAKAEKHIDAIFIETGECEFY